MSSTPSADRIAREVTRYADKLRQSVEKSARAILVKRIEEEAIEASSLSDHTLEDLAAMGHPYSTRFPTDSGPHEDALIHHQTEIGGFVDSFHSEITATPDGVVYRLTNDSPHWRYLKDGTSKMRPRPLHKYLADVIVSDVFPEFARAVQKAMDQLRSNARRTAP